MNIKIDRKSSPPGLSMFFIESLEFFEGRLTLKINSGLNQIHRIAFDSNEAFQVFRESDYHPIFTKYDLLPLTPVHEGDCGVFRAGKRPSDA
jgi:hypothetical protein